MPEFFRSAATKAFNHSLRGTVSRKGSGTHKEKSTCLPVHIVGLDCVPITPPPSLVNVRPANDGDRMAMDHENRFSVPVGTRIVPHSVQAGDVVSKSGCGRDRHIAFSKDEACAVPKNQRAFAGDLLVSLLRCQIEGGSQKAGRR